MTLTTLLIFSIALLQFPEVSSGPIGFDWGSIVPYALTPITGVITYLLGRKQQKNSFLQDMQKSIDLLSGENARLLKELVTVNNELLEVRKENKTLLLGQIEMKRENETLVTDIAALKKQLEGVKTITRTK